MTGFRTLIAILLLIGSANGDFEFVNTGGVVTGKEGDRDIVLECAITETPEVVTFAWTLDGHLVQGDGRRSQVGSNLHLARILAKYDSGDWRCVGTGLSTGFTLTSPPIRINVIWLSDTAEVELAKPGKGQEIRKGQEVILECRVEGTLEIKFQWYRNGELLDENKGRRLSVGKRLHLTSVTGDDNGSYKCEASSDTGSVTSALFHLIISDDGFPVLLVPPQSQIVLRNSVVGIDCVFGGETPVEWIFSGEPLLPNNPRFSLLENGSLLIGRLTENEVGLYKCLTKPPAKHTQVYAAEIQMGSLEPLTLDSLLPKPLSLKHQLGFASGSTAEVHCSPPLGLPRPKVTWELPSKESGKIQIRDSDTLVFSHLSPADEGEYTCRADNIAGSLSIGFHLVLTKPPRMTGHPTGVVSEEGEVVTFWCPHTASPWPLTRIQWTHNQATIKHSHHHHRMRNWEQNGTLVISGTRAEDRGNYACQVTTQGYPPITSKPALLSVVEKLKFVSPPVDRRLELGSTYKIPCRATGVPLPTINWIKVGQPHFAWPPHITDDNGVLHFDQIQKTDHGIYACFATNSQGIINTTIQINVFASPKFVVKPKNPTEAVEGESVTIDCRAVGDPFPTIKWDKDTDTASIDGDRFIVFENGSLYIREVKREDHHHRFGCTAGNSGGFKREEVELMVTTNDEYISSEKSGVMTRTVWITLSVAASYMLLVVGLMLWCRYRQLKRKQTYLADIRGDLGETELKDGLLPIPNGTTVKPIATRTESVKSDAETGTHSSGLGQTKTASAPGSVASHRSNQSKRSYAEISGDRKDLQFVMLLGHGIFGEVFLAKGKVNNDERLVMVKSLEMKEEGSLTEFKREIDLFNKLRHENISALVRLCREMDPHYMIMEYSDWGDLKQFLLATRPEHPRTPKPPPLSTTQILQVVSQVATGMDHLAANRLVHKDLAARNCLISSGLRVQISNPSLSRDTYANEYFSFRNKLVPLRWLSPEALLEDDYSTKSDVWAFGCLVWEVCHQAALPWFQLKETEIVGQLERKERRRLDLEGIPETLRPLLEESLDFCPSKRPTFSAISTTLGGKVQK